jgi:hypothetical protein
MKALRKIVRTDDAILRIKLPKDFRHKDLELIILPCEPSSNTKDINEKTDFQDFLKNLPIMTDAQYKDWENEGGELYSWLKE